MDKEEAPVLMIAKRKVKRRKHSHSNHKHRSEGYSKSVHAGRFRKLDKVETSILGVIFKVLLMVGITALLLWGLTYIL